MKGLSLLPVLVLCAAAHADVKLPAIFGDHMVLQRNMPVPVWGWADPGEEVSVKFAGQTKTTTAGKDGSWQVKLGELKASADAATLTIKGRNEIVLNDILVGEVWVCSGQSNMGFTVERAINGKDEVAKSANKNIRMFMVPLSVADEPQKDLVKRDAKSVWLEAGPETSGGFTAAGYFFGRELEKELKVPVGLINTSWGGTRAEAWTSKPALEAVPACKSVIDAWNEVLKSYDAAKDREKHDAQMKLAQEKIEQVKAANATPGATQHPVPPAPRPWEDLAKSQHRPAVLFNAMISPIVPFATRGAVWYQGESNAGRAQQYLTLLPTMIKDWRKHWGYDFSFYIVQLASYGHTNPESWAELQWTQLQTAIRPGFKAGLAVANDIGEENDIHPKNKQEVGRRLALQALVKDYGRKDLVPGGPIYAGGAPEGDHYVVNFSNAANGLKTRDGGELKGFIIAGEDKVWHPAKARIKNGKQVYLSSSEVKKPVAVRYYWQSWNPEANLVNKEGLPASVFRTDDWALSTKGQENPFGSKPSTPGKKPEVKAPAKAKEDTRPAVIPAAKDEPPRKKAA